ncbi:MAG: tyrosine-type recombinase/integrase [Thermaerobacter sp.]|nr:tyrosine-type recombinase/integrase [Thermaerobacter sp.]
MDRQDSLRKEEAARLLQRTEGEVHLAVALMLFGGLRVGEVAELRHRDVVVGQKIAKIHVGRGNKVDSVKATGRFRDLLAGHRGVPDELVIGRRTGDVPDMLKRAMRAQGITASCYALRHTYATSETGED